MYNSKTDLASTRRRLLRGLGRLTGGGLMLLISSKKSLAQAQPEIRWEYLKDSLGIGLTVLVPPEIEGVGVSIRYRLAGEMEIREQKATLPVVQSQSGDGFASAWGKFNSSGPIQLVQIRARLLKMEQEVTADYSY